MNPSLFSDPDLASNGGGMESLRALRKFTGRDGEFWLAFAEQSCRLFEAELITVFRDSGEGWRQFCRWPLDSSNEQVSGAEQMLGELSGDAVVYRQHETGVGSWGGFSLKCVSDDGGMAMVFYRLRHAAPETDKLKRELVFDIPESFRTNAIASSPGVSGHIDPLGLLLCMDGQEGFIAAAMALCNELASRSRCSMVSFGWKEGQFVRVRAMSGMERFDRKMQVVQALEAAMEECADQEEALVVPVPEGADVVVREHRGYAVRQGRMGVLSIPLRSGSGVVGVVTCERDRPFSAKEVSALRSSCDKLARRFVELNRLDRSFSTLLIDAAKQWAVRVFGQDRALRRFYGIAAALLFAILLLGRIEYRIEAPFILRTKDIVLLSAPFDGYIEKVYQRPGDLVSAGQLLLSLDMRQLRLEQSRSHADVQRYLQEEIKAMAQDALAEMRVAAAQRMQAESRYALIQDNLDHAGIRAPFSGVVVEGDLEKLLGAPVRKGDVLLKVARLGNLYVEMKVPERDIQELRVGQEGEIAFISRPSERFRVVVDRIEPMAVSDEKGTTFLVLAHLKDTRAVWWRPGMSGLAKVDVGGRPILWIMLHRTFDYLHMKLWW